MGDLFASAPEVSRSFPGGCPIELGVRFFQASLSGPGNGPYGGADPLCTLALSAGARCVFACMVVVVTTA